MAGATSSPPSAPWAADVQMRNRLQQKGLLRSFTINCYGKQETMESIRAHKAFLYNELQDKPYSKKYEKYFFYGFFPEKKNKLKEDL